MQLGPTRRRPPAAALATTSSCSVAPAAPVSAKPLEQMIATGTPARTQSSTAAGTRSADTMIMARSTPAGQSDTDGYEDRPHTSAPSGRTG